VVLGVDVVVDVVPVVMATATPSALRRKTFRPFALGVAVAVAVK
jgi:hypothetical protein